MTLVRTTRERRCPICDKPDWCSIQVDESGTVTGAVCMRIKSEQPTRNGGSWHWLRERTWRVPRPARRIQLQTRQDWSEPVAQGIAATSDADLKPHADAMRVSIGSLRSASCFTWQRFPGALCIPMFDALGNVTGIRLRYLDGRKRAVTGSTEGMFVPTLSPTVRTLAITEGFSDTAAGLDLAPELAWIGRPSCTGAVLMTVEFVRERVPNLVVVIADRDEAGQHGAAALARLLRLICVDVRLLTPPAPHKDLRAWAVAGATRDGLLDLIAAAPPLPRLRMEVIA